MKKLLTLALAAMAGMAYANTPAGAPQASGFPSILLLVVFVVIFYFLLIRPQMKRSKEQRQLMSALEKGDEVITASGLYGKVVRVEEVSVDVEVADNVVVKMQKQAIISLLPKGTVVETKA